MCGVDSMMSVRQAVSPPVASHAVHRKSAVAPPAVDHLPLPRLQRKCACGGFCPHCQEQDKIQTQIQTNLSVSMPGDPDELEADRVADQVMRMPASGAAPFTSASIPAAPNSPASA